MTWVWRAINALFGAVIAGFRTMLFFYFLLTYALGRIHGMKAALEKERSLHE